MPTTVSASATASPDALCIEWEDGTRSEFASVWLRDNLPEDRDGHSGQRLTDVTTLPAEPRIRSATVADTDVRIVWQDEPRVSIFALDWLYDHRSARNPNAPPPVRTWLDGALLQARRDFAWQTMTGMSADPELRLQWLTRLLQDGMAFMSEVAPVDAGILQAMTLVGRVAETNYGLVFDVRTVAEPENLAYSDRGLGLHTDNPYRQPVPGFQALHTLVAAPDGGESVFADGFALAEHLRQRVPEAFEILTRTPVPFRYRSRQADLYAERPLIQLDCAGAVAAVHYNSRSIAPLRLPAQDCRAFYAAYRHLGTLLREPRFQLRIRLGNGDIVVFDNQRILHGRSGFASSSYPRHLRGCYLTRDSVYSEAALLRGRTTPGDTR
jgi:Taurine catabolism dioxygenase TauD, TfdA family/Gamma-butyrobetaine hydroxylase-like, N-terminal